MTMKDLVDVFDECEKYNLPICVTLKLPDTPSNELIINTPDNFEKKLEYYKNMYDENLVNKNNSEIKIVNAFPIEFFLNSTDSD